MGCDSHVFIEVYRNGQWELVDDENRYWKLLDHHRVDFYDRRPSYINFFGCRNYTRFAVLAGVRDYGMGTKALFGGRGLPDDVSEEVEKELPFDGDYHSHTFFTLQELIDVDWNATAVHEDVALFADDYANWQEHGVWPEKPIVAEAANGASAANRTSEHRQVTDGEMTLLLMANRPEDLVSDIPSRWGGERRDGPFVVKSMPRSYSSLLSGVLKVIEDMKALGDPTSVRVVLAFDN